MEIKTVALERTKLQIKKIFNPYPYLQYHTSLDTYRNELDQLVLTMATEVLAYVDASEPEFVESFSNTITRPRFASPWEHFKAKYAGRIWMRRYVKRHPVKFTYETFPVSVNVKINLTKYHTFPSATCIFSPELGNPVVQFRVDSQPVNWKGPVDR